MPPQHVEIAETVAALRRKLRRDRQSTPGQSAQIATNRGHKLKPGARFVHAGSLPWRSGLSSSRSGWTEKINHAGYDRDILSRNPRRYNEYGDELEDSESDAEADADADDENAYADVRLEELLRPLTHPSDLANHPTLALAYTDPALPEMVIATEAKIREERNNLWRAKNLYRFFTGDDSWIPCDRVEAETDWDLFGPQAGFSGSPSKRRKLSGELESQIDGSENGDADMDVDGDVQIADVIDEERNLAPSAAMLNGTVAGLQNSTREEGEKQEGLQDVSMLEAEQTQQGQQEQPQTTNGVEKREEGEEQKERGSAERAQENGIDLKKEQNEDGGAAPNDGHGETEAPTNGAEDAADDNEEDEDRPSPASTPPPPPRRMTRALAAEAETNSQQQNPSPPPTSPSPTLSSPPLSATAFEPDPLFLLPPHFAALRAPHPSHYPLSLSLAHSGLPPDELLETRKLLGIFIQKSEETIRGLESILAKLIKAKRRRDRLYEWCIAEGHADEMSDGEDWIDEARWGLEKGELRKGRDEDGGVGGVAVDGATAGGGETEDTAGGVVMGGRKGKRRRGAAAKE